MNCRLLLAAVVATTGWIQSIGQLSGPVRTESPAEPGNGATLTVIAPDALCDDDINLMVSRTVTHGRRYVFQTPVSPPECRWTITDVLPGDYQAVLHKARGDRRIVGMARLNVYPGSAWTLTISPLTATVEGLISVAGRPVGPGTFVEVKQFGAPGWSWETRTDGDGHYKVAVATDQRLCVYVTLPEALTSLSAECQDFGPGSNRKDFDIPAGRIDVTLIPRDGAVHETEILLVLDTPGHTTSRAITVAGRIQGRFVGLQFGKQRVRATTIDYQQVFDAADVVLSADEPVKAITLSVPYSR